MTCRPLHFLLLLPALTLSLSFTHAQASTGSVNLLLGEKMFDSRDSQPSVALDLLWGHRDWPVLFNPYLSGSWDKYDTPIYATTTTEANYEAGFGLTRVWNLGSFHPHAGGGAGYMWRRVHIEGQENTERRRLKSSDVGLWLGAGTFWRLPSGLNLGAAIRFSGLATSGYSLGGTHVGITVGWGWPG